MTSGERKYGGRSYASFRDNGNLIVFVNVTIAGNDVIG